MVQGCCLELVPEKLQHKSHVVSLQGNLGVGFGVQGLRIDTNVMGIRV